MRNCILLPFLVCLFFLQGGPLYGDIVVTIDGMVLNGKILEKHEPDSILLGNYHGTFRIERSKIKEIHETRSFEDDVKLLSKMNKPVNIAEVEKNYDAGVRKLSKMGALDDGIAAVNRYGLFCSVFVSRTTGRLSDVLPYVYGIAVSGEVLPGKSASLMAVKASGIRAEVAGINSKNEERSVQGSRISAGILWRFPASLGSVKFCYDLLPIFGIGWYTAKGSYRQASGFKWSCGLQTGPVMTFGRIDLSTRIRFDYIYDAAAPLYGLGFSVEAGRRFDL